MAFTKPVPVANDTMRASVIYGDNSQAQVISNVSSVTDSYTGKKTYTLTGAINTVVISEDYLVLNYPLVNGVQHWSIQK